MEYVAAQQRARAWIESQFLQPQADGTFLVRPFRRGGVFTLPDAAARDSYVDDMLRRHYFAGYGMVGLILVELVAITLEMHNPGIMLFGWASTLAMTSLILLFAVALHMRHRSVLKRLGARRAPRARWNRIGRRSFLSWQSNAEIQGHLIACFCAGVFCTVLNVMAFPEIVSGGWFWPALLDIVIISGPFAAVAEAIDGLRVLSARRHGRLLPPVS